MKSLKQYLKESETYGIWDSEATDRTEMGESEQLKKDDEKSLNESYYIKRKDGAYFCNLNGLPAFGKVKDLAMKFNSEDKAKKYMVELGSTYPYVMSVVNESSSSFSKSKIIPLDKVKSFMDKARAKYDVDSHMEGNELVHSFYKKGTSNHVGTFVNSNRTYFYNDVDKIVESNLFESNTFEDPIYKGRTDVYEIVNEFPNGYQVLNIGREHFPHKGYIPLCKLSSGYNVDMNSLKALKVKDEPTALKILNFAKHEKVDKNKYKDILSGKMDKPSKNVLRVTNAKNLNVGDIFAENPSSKVWFKVDKIVGDKIIASNTNDKKDILNFSKHDNYKIIIKESAISEATMSDIPHEIDDQIHKLKDMRFELEETQKNWELAGLDTTPLSNVITGINELIHSMYNNGAKLADQEVVNESTSHDKEWEIWTLYRRYEDEVNNKWEKDLFSFDTKEEAEKYAKGSRFNGHHVQIVHKGDKPKKLKDLKEDAPLYSKVKLLKEWKDAPTLGKFLDLNDIPGEEFNRKLDSYNWDKFLKDAHEGKLPSWFNNSDTAARDKLWDYAKKKSGKNDKDFAEYVKKSIIWWPGK